MGKARDNELHDIRRIMAILQAMPMPQRLRVLRYVQERVELLAPPILPQRRPPAEEPQPSLPASWQADPS
jgi:hypothetical protein